jgi:hypothetical protein
VTVFVDDSLQLRPEPPDCVSHFRYRLHASLLRLVLTIPSYSRWLIIHIPLLALRSISEVLRLSLWLGDDLGCK